MSESLDFHQLLDVIYSTYNLTNEIWDERALDSTENRELEFLSHSLECAVGIAHELVIFNARSGGIRGWEINYFDILAKLIESLDDARYIFLSARWGNDRQIFGQLNAASRMARSFKVAVFSDLNGVLRSDKTEKQPPGRLVSAIAKTACRMLPASYRSRYLDEFRSELFDLPRRHRLAYAARLLRSTPAIRVGLRERPAAAGTNPDST